MVDFLLLFLLTSLLILIHKNVFNISNRTYNMALHMDHDSLKQHKSVPWTPLHFTFTSTTKYFIKKSLLILCEEHFRWIQTLILILY